MKRRVAISENFNGTKKVEALYDVKESSFELIFTKQGMEPVVAIVPREFLEEVQACLTDLKDMKGRYYPI